MKIMIKIINKNFEEFRNPDFANRHGISSIKNNKAIFASNTENKYLSKRSYYIIVNLL